MLPGRYTVRLTVEGRVSTQPLVVRMDPRVKTSAEDLAKQHALSMALVEGLSKSDAALRRASAARAGGEPSATERALARLNAQLGQLLGIVQGVDAAPTSQVEAAVAEVLK